MNKSVLALFGATALTIGSAANATITLTSGSVTGVLTAGNGGTVTVSNPDANDANIAFGNNTTPTGTVTGSGFSFSNSLTGVYNITISDSSLPSLTLSNVMFAGQSVSSIDGGATFTLFGVTLGAGGSPYGVSFDTTNSSGVTQTFNGNIHFTAVPEPATWAMMLLGFGAIGFSMRSRRRTTLAQAA